MALRASSVWPCSPCCWPSASVLARERARMPLMLLDDVMSELDSDRRELLARELSSGGQSVIATTDLAHVPGAGGGSVTRLRISPGAILQEALAA